MPSFAERIIAGEYRVSILAADGKIYRRWSKAIDVVKDSKPWDIVSPWRSIKELLYRATKTRIDYRLIGGHWQDNRQPSLTIQLFGFLQIWILLSDKSQFFRVSIARIGGDICRCERKEDRPELKLELATNDFLVEKDRGGNDLVFACDTLTLLRKSGFIFEECDPLFDAVYLESVQLIFNKRNR